VGAALTEALVWTVARFAAAEHEERKPRSILVLRNNDLGDLLVVTPLFDALRRRFPAAEIVAAVGRWNVATLRHNPHLSDVLVIDAPWFNKFLRRQSFPRILSYIAFSAQARTLARRGFDAGIDVLGSPWGSLLLLRAGIPLRLGVRGYAGGHTGVSLAVGFDPEEQVGRSALRFAELLGATDLPSTRPQIFLDDAERFTGEQIWCSRFAPERTRVVVAPAGGLAARCWPPESFAELTALLVDEGRAVVVAGGPRDRALGERVAAAAPSASEVVNLAGHLSLRETFALLAAADLVLCNSSVLLHAAAAFKKPAWALLGPSFPSARQHDAQWGHPGCRSLGREAGSREEIYTPAEVLADIQEYCRAQGREPWVDIAARTGREEAG
jgi:ADP-heptose:LPS heptosyltransferase